MIKQFGIIVSARTKSVRRIVVSNDANYDYTLHIGDGEQLIIGNAERGTDVHIARAEVERITGLPSPEPIVAVVDHKSNVVNVIMADTVLDTIKGHDLIKADRSVSVGHSYYYRYGVFVDPKDSN